MEFNSYFPPNLCLKHIKTLKEKVKRFNNYKKCKILAIALTCYSPSELNSLSDWKMNFYLWKTQEATSGPSCLF